jgi:uncharacterized protein (TIGR00730 family)
MEEKKYISIFGSYKPKKGDEEYNAAYKLAFELSKKGYIIKNGGGSGIMEASTMGAIDAGGESIGYILDFYSKIEGVTEKNKIIICKSLFERLRLLIEESKGFILFSGGTGTLTELAFTWELINKGLLSKFPIICYKDYWKPVFDIFKKNTFYVNNNTLELIKFINTIDEILSIL